MTSFDLEELELISMSEIELIENYGGIWKDIAIPIAGGIIADWKDFKSGMAAGLSAN